MKKSVRLQGIPASPGIAIAELKVINRQKIRIPRLKIEPNDVAAEKNRLNNAVRESKKQIKTVMKTFLNSSGEQGDHSIILQAHLLMLDDVLLIDGASTIIENELINAEWAFSKKVEEATLELATLGDAYFSERSQDVEFVGDRILRNLLGHRIEIFSNILPDSNCVLVSSNLSPAETAQMLSSPVIGFAIEEGTRTSHTAIMAQALGIPAVVGVEFLTENVSIDDTIIVDGIDGVVIIRPDELSIKLYLEKAAKWNETESKLRSTRDDPAVTTDNVSVKLMCNIELPAEAPLALDLGADGVGLYRTEFLFLNRETPPSEDEQYKIFYSVVKTMGSKPIIFRTFDLGADKMPKNIKTIEKNPALGLRAIRIGLKNKAMFKTHMRALLRAGVHGNASIMFPMISGITELRETKSVLEEAKNELGLQADSNIKIGCMIELPSAVFVADLLAKEVDFFSIGTNDLIQYSIAIDRSNDHVAYLYSPYHPSIIRAIKLTIDAANNANIPVSMCGSAAGELNMAPLLLGLGLRSFSIAPHTLPFLKAAIRVVCCKEAKEIANQALKYATATEVENLVEEYMREKLVDN